MFPPLHALHAIKDLNLNEQRPGVDVMPVKPQEEDLLSGQRTELSSCSMDTSEIGGQLRQENTTTGQDRRAQVSSDSSCI